MNELGKLSGAGGCQLINAAGTYTTAGGTLIPGVVTLVVITGAAAAITALEIKPADSAAIELPAVHNIIDATIPDGAILTFRHPISEITVAADVVLIAYAG